MSKIDQKCPEIFELISVQNCPKPEMSKNAQKWPEMARNSQKYHKMSRNIQSPKISKECPKVSKVNPKMSRNIQSNKCPEPQWLLFGIFVRKVFDTNLNFRYQWEKNLKKYSHQVTNFWNWHIKSAFSLSDRFLTL